MEGRGEGALAETDDSGFTPSTSPAQPCPASTRPLPASRHAVFPDCLKFPPLTRGLHADGRTITAEKRFDGQAVPLAELPRKTGVHLLDSEDSVTGFQPQFSVETGTNQ